MNPAPDGRAAQGLMHMFIFWRETNQVRAKSSLCLRFLSAVQPSMGEGIQASHDIMQCPSDAHESIRTQVVCVLASFLAKSIVIFPALSNPTNILLFSRIQVHLLALGPLTWALITVTRKVFMTLIKKHFRGCQEMLL